ncbi:MAG: sulfatase-like hydrolase/transferase, partial [Armatimonadetes bacterium]|nr:sulfatase-like hydrolase/transferase [Armatimonadota bacterium]
MTRRDLLRIGALAAGGVAAASAFGAHADTGDREERAMPPNIVLFLVDDMGWQDTSLPFHETRTPFNNRYHTPNMERLADSGVRFTQAYSCSLCPPTRVSLMPG